MCIRDRSIALSKILIESALNIPIIELSLLIRTAAISQLKLFIGADKIAFHILHAKQPAPQSAVKLAHLLADVYKRQVSGGVSGGEGTRAARDARKCGNADFCLGYRPEDGGNGKVCLLYTSRCV